MGIFGAQKLLLLGDGVTLERGGGLKRAAVGGQESEVLAELRHLDAVGKHLLADLQGFPQVRLGAVPLVLLHQDHEHSVERFGELLRDAGDVLLHERQGMLHLILRAGQIAGAAVEHGEVVAGFGGFHGIGAGRFFEHGQAAAKDGLGAVELALIDESCAQAAEDGGEQALVEALFGDGEGSAGRWGRLRRGGRRDVARLPDC